jgi:hypothetical protein
MTRFQYEPYARRVPALTAADTTGTYSAKVGTGLRACGTAARSAGVTAGDHHPGLGGHGQPVTAPPAQRGDGHPVGYPAGGVDPAEPVNDVRPARRAGHWHGTARTRLALPEMATAGARDDRRNRMRSHGCLPDGRHLHGQEPGRPLGSAARRVFKCCSFWEIALVFVSEGGLEHLQRLNTCSARTRSSGVRPGGLVSARPCFIADLWR